MLQPGDPGALELDEDSSIWSMWRNSSRDMGVALTCSPPLVIGRSGMLNSPPLAGGRSGVTNSPPLVIGRSGMDK
eukprot:6587145-Pyramimonas_sp.AAC.1